MLVQPKGFSSVLGTLLSNLKAHVEPPWGKVNPHFQSLQHRPVCLTQTQPAWLRSVLGATSSTVLLILMVTAAYSDQGMFVWWPAPAALDNHMHGWIIAGLGVAVQASKSR